MNYHPAAYSDHGFANVGDWLREKSIPVVVAEATAAGLVEVDRVRHDETDLGRGVYYDIVFESHGWTFRRQWAYWSASTTTAPLALGKAKALWSSHGGAVRAEGHCGSPEPDQAVWSYHIDTPKGLQMLIAALA